MAVKGRVKRLMWVVWGWLVNKAILQSYFHIWFTQIGFKAAQWKWPEDRAAENPAYSCVPKQRIIFSPRLLEKEEDRRMCLQGPVQVKGASWKATKVMFDVSTAHFHLPIW